MNDFLAKVCAMKATKRIPFRSRDCICSTWMRLHRPKVAVLVLDKKLGCFGTYGKRNYI